jgi:hypothetical protein
MIFGYFTLLVALTISAVAEFYSIVGLTAIFSAAFWPIVIMGASLGVGKVTAAVWLKLNWERASWTYKLYLVPAVAFLMILTSMGIFGYLSKAHSDQSLVSGDAVAKVAIYDEKIKISKDNVEANRRALKQMDESVDQVMGRSTDEKGADKAVALRRGQQKERSRLLSEIETEQKNIARLNEERAPLAAEFRKVESEVGPIKYIASLVYGENPDANVLERAVRLVIILIVAVFDPLALVLILAAQQSLRWAKQEQEEQKFSADIELKQEVAEVLDAAEPETVEDTRSIFERHPYLLKPFSHFKGTTPVVAPKEEPVEPEAQPVVYPPDWGMTPIPIIPDVDRPGDYITPPEEDDEEDETIKAAIKKWKNLNPNDTIKNQRYKFMRGEIAELPWMGLVADNVSGKESHSGFGISFPADPEKGDTFVRVDIMPSILYKYNGFNWIAVDKNLSDSYTYDSAYIEHLIDKISTGEYDPDLLSDSERAQVEQYLQTKESQ